MELILIDENKIKIMLSSKDMTKYGIACDDLSYDDTKTRRAFWNILDDAKHKTGFDAAKEKVYIQVFPCYAGGCEIFVTRLHNTKEYDEDIELEVKRGIRQTDVYTFENINDLLSVCNILNKNGYKGESAAYFDSCSFHLALTTNKTKKSSTKFSFIGDFAIKKDDKFSFYHLKEYCNTICEKDAVCKLASLY